MVRVNSKDFDNKEVARIYMARRLAEAKEVEKTLTDNGINYYLEIEPFVTYIFGLFQSKRRGVAFYVVSGQANFCRQALIDEGLHEGVIDEELS
jgi:hypothetical protein